MGQWHEFICIRSVNGKAGGIETEGLCFTTKLPFICIPNNFRNYCCRWIRGCEHLVPLSLPFLFLPSWLCGARERDLLLWFLSLSHAGKVSAQTFWLTIFSPEQIVSGDFLSPYCFLIHRPAVTFDWPFSHLSKLSAGTFCHLVFSFTGLWHLTVHFLTWANCQRGLFVT